MRKAEINVRDLLLLESATKDDKHFEVRYYDEHGDCKIIDGEHVIYWLTELSALNVDRWEIVKGRFVIWGKIRNA